ncbi:MAG TPA: energy transducer TonB [Vicinamibacterales bacterium]|nr:energy transducer TonB [Vicinamibacterales bacterium]
MRSILTVAALAVALAATGLAQSEVYQVGGGVKSPRLTKEVKPNYTEGAMHRKVAGLVEMKVVVLADGTVGDDVRITKSLDDELDQQAIIAVKQWRFQPGTKDDKPVAVQVDIEMTFTLRDKK